MRFERPIIGITLGIVHDGSRVYDRLHRAYQYAIEKSGGVPVGLFNTKAPETVAGYLQKVDAILFSGGPDVDPKYYGEKPITNADLSIADPFRDEFELLLIKKAIEEKMPLLCICRGHQVLNVALGGSLYQDLSLYDKYDQVGVPHKDKQESGDVFHEVVLAEGSLLWQVVGHKRIRCNSSHHQAVKQLGIGLRPTAWAPDGVIEGLEFAGHPFLLSVQWHPERIFDEPHSRRLFATLVDFAARYRAG